MPERYEFAEENTRFEYDLYRVIIGKYVAIYTVDRPVGVVYVVGFRHSGRLPRVGDLPDNPAR